jgi:uncharacterized membrane protein YeiB
MTQIEISHATSPPRHTAPAEPTGVVEQRPSVGRLVGVDLARALAVFGMFAVHVGPFAVDVGGLGGWLLELAEGRSSILFATLAGFSPMLIAGRFEPKTGLAGRQARVRIAIRALVMLVLGTALTMLKTGIAVILAFYGVYFLLALPLIRLRARTLAIIAAVLAVVGPQAAFGLKWLRRLASPLIAVGTMSLTLYVAHVAAYTLLSEGSTSTLVPLLGFIAGAILFATIWSRFFRRGPLEHLLNSTTKLAKFVR